MNDASKIFEAHIHTVHLSNDPLILEFMSEILPLVQEHIELSELEDYTPSLLEANGQLSWNDIDVIFKAAQKVSKGGILDRAVGAGKEKLSAAKEKVASTVSSKLSSMVDKYETAAPMKNASVKIEKLQKRAVDALKQSKDAGSLTLIKKVDQIAKFASQNPRVANIAVAILTTAISFSKSSAATFAVGMVLNSGLKKLQTQMGNRDMEAKSHEPAKEVEQLRGAYHKAFSNATRLVPPKKRSKIERSVENMFKYGQQSADNAKKILPIMQDIASSVSASDILNAVKKARNIRSETNESLERILWRV